MPLECGGIDRLEFGDLDLVNARRRLAGISDLLRPTLAKDPQQIISRYGYDAGPPCS